MMKLLLILACISFHVCYGAREEEGAVREGNFALPASQQPAPLLAFGQNIVEKGDIIEYTYTVYQMGKCQKLSDITPSLLYGVTDYLSLYLNIPIAAKLQVDDRKSSGLEDVFIQAEYLFFNIEKPRSAFGITAVGALFFPTGSLKKNPAGSIKKKPATSTGSFSFLLGSTVSYTSVKWYAYVSPFVGLALKKSGTRFGNRFYYQAGVGRNAVGNPDGWLITPVLELYGLYMQKDIISGAIDPDTGGNIIYLGPAVWAATKRFTGQAGIAVAVTQQLNGNQKKQHCLFEVSLGWKFNA